VLGGYGESADAVKLTVTDTAAAAASSTASLVLVSMLGWEECLKNNLSRVE